MNAATKTQSNQINFKKKRKRELVPSADTGWGSGWQGRTRLDNRKHQERSNSFLPSRPLGPICSRVYLLCAVTPWPSVHRGGRDPGGSHSVLCFISPRLSVPGRLARESLAFISLRSQGSEGSRDGLLGAEQGPALLHSTETPSCPVGAPSSTPCV